MQKVIKTRPQIIMKNGKPQAVIITIREYEKILELLEDKEDMEELNRLRKGALSFRKLDDFLKAHNEL